MSLLSKPVVHALKNLFPGIAAVCLALLPWGCDHRDPSVKTGGNAAERTMMQSATAQTATGTVIRIDPHDQPSAAGVGEGAQDAGDPIVVRQLLLQHQVGTLAPRDLPEQFGF